MVYVCILYVLANHPNETTMGQIQEILGSWCQIMAQSTDVLHIYAIHFQNKTSRFYGLFFIFSPDIR